MRSISRDWNRHLEACVVACQEDEGFSSEEGYSEEEYGSDKDGADEEDSSDEEDDPNHDDSLKWVALTSFTWLKLFDTSVHDASASRFNTFTKLENLSISASTFPKGMQAIFQLPALDTLEFKNLHTTTLQSMIGMCRIAAAISKNCMSRIV
jgi:hypothetical protein